MKRYVCAAAVIAAGLGLGLGASAQNGPSPAKYAVEIRQSIYTLIGANFGPIGAILKGDKAYDAAEVQKRLSRIAFLAPMLDEAFPEISNVGEPETKAKPEIWANRADFDKKLKAMQAAVKDLVEVNNRDKADNEAFKTAAMALGQACKNCHDTYRAK